MAGMTDAQADKIIDLLQDILGELKGCNTGLSNIEAAIDTIDRNVNTIDDNVSSMKLDVHTIDDNVREIKYKD